MVPPHHDVRPVASDEAADAVARAAHDDRLESPGDDRSVTGRTRELVVAPLEGVPLDVAALDVIVHTSGGIPRS